LKIKGVGEVSLDLDGNKRQARTSRAEDKLHKRWRSQHLHDQEQEEVDEDR